QVLDSWCGRSASPVYRDLPSLSARSVERPNAKVSFEDDRSPVVRNVWPQHAPVLESSNLSRIVTGGGSLLISSKSRFQAPDVLRSIPVRDEEDRRTVGAPHRPHVLSTDRSQPLVFVFAASLPRRSFILHQPDVAFVQMRMTLSPPLSRGDASAGERKRVSVGRRCAEEFVCVAVRADLHRRAAFCTHSEHVVQPGDVPARGRKV